MYNHRHTLNCNLFMFAIEFWLTHEYGWTSKAQLQSNLASNLSEKTAKGKVVHESTLDMVITGQHSSPLSLHYPKWKVCAARFPASRGALLSNTRAAQPSDQTSLVTPGLEQAGHPHETDGPHPESHVHTFLPLAQVTSGCYTTQLHAYNRSNLAL
jgi:hypothetical protein